MTSFALVALLAAQELAPLVWGAVDASERDYPKALMALRKHPEGNWREVMKVLKEGRVLRVKGHVAIDDPERLKEALKRVRWSNGDVRIYDLGDTPGAFYGLQTSPGLADEKLESSKRRIPVYLDLGMPLTNPNWAYVQPNWAMVTLMEQSGIPMSMTAGRNFQSLVLSILADLERRMHVDRARVVAGGFSRGGNATLYFGTHWPDRFAGIITASGYYKVEDRLLNNLRHVAVLAASGADKGHRDSNAFTAKLATALKRRGHSHVDTFRSKGRAIDDPFRDEAWKWIMGNSGVALPRRVRYALRDPAHRGAYWLEITKPRPSEPRETVRILEPGGVVKEEFRLHRRVSWVDAEVRPENQIVVRMGGVDELVIRLSPELVDLAREVNVRVGARTRAHVPKPTVNRLIANYRRDRDPRRLYPAEIVVKP
ncbi:MAG: hypothetical protein ACYTGZ_07810 [Planctomycetota bacterium]|jgi:predicted esterase